MSKYSKKLVSKCTYINILNATPHDRLSLYVFNLKLSERVVSSTINSYCFNFYSFYDRGGWGMLFTWTSDAVEKKNYDLLREILTLLLNSPVNLKRLKENSLPKLVKAVSKNCPVPGKQTFLQFLITLLNCFLGNLDGSFFSVKCSISPSVQLDIARPLAFSGLVASFIVPLN